MVGKLHPCELLLVEFFTRNNELYQKVHRNGLKKVIIEMVKLHGSERIRLIWNIRT